MSPTAEIEDLWTGPHPRISDADLLFWVSRFKFVPTDILCDVARIRWSRMRRRLATLRCDGLIEIKLVKLHRPRGVFLTRSGYLSLDLPAKRPVTPTSTDYHHERAIAHFVEIAERSANEAKRVFTERDIRRLESEFGDQWSVPKVGTKNAYHWPDLVAEHEHGRTYIEIEFTGKSECRVEEILNSYAYSDVTGVVYYVNSTRVTSLVQRAAVRTGIGERLVIKPWLELDTETAQAITAKSETLKTRKSRSTNGS